MPGKSKKKGLDGMHTKKEAHRCRLFRRNLVRDLKKLKDHREKDAERKTVSRKALSESGPAINISC